VGPVEERLQALDLPEVFLRLKHVLQESGVRIVLLHDMSEEVAEGDLFLRSQQRPHVGNLLLNLLSDQQCLLILIAYVPLDQDVELSLIFRY
jgi:hypothetical protein